MVADLNVDLANLALIAHPAFLTLTVLFLLLHRPEKAKVRGMLGLLYFDILLLNNCHVILLVLFDLREVY